MIILKGLIPNSNTSYVAINHSYISISSTSKLNSNTSYVAINRSEFTKINKAFTHSNTSYVAINLLGIMI